MNKKGRVKAVSLMGAIGAMCLAGGFVGAVSVSAEEQTLPISAITENISAVATSSGEMSVATGKHTTRTGLWYFGKDTEWQSQTGVQTVVSAASGIKAAGTVTYKKDIDLSCFTKDDYLARCMPWNENIASITMKLIDSADSGNYVSVKWESDQNYYYEGSGYKTYLGSDCTITYNNGTEYATTAPKYESGLIMGLLFPMQDVFGNEGGVGCNILGDGSSIWVGVNSEYIDMFSLAYENGKFYTPRNEYDLTGWKGFADEKAKLEISYTSFNNNNGLMFTHLAGLNVRGDTVVNEAPQISVDDISIPSFNANQTVSLPLSSVRVYDKIDGILQPQLKFQHKNGEAWEDQAVNISETGKCYFSLAGEWKAVISAADAQGLETTKELPFTVNESKISMKDGGASIRMAQPNGLGFRTYIDYAYYNALAANSAVTDLTTGTLILPNDYLSEGVEFTIEGLTKANKEFKNIVNDGFTNAGTAETDGNYIYRGSLVNIKTGNYTRDFAARGYISYKLNGETIYEYTAFVAAKNVRNVAEIATAALADVKDVQEGKYIYLVDDSSDAQYGKYSCYTKAQREMLAGYLNAADEN